VVNFSVFNELSLPFEDTIGIDDKFITFIKLLNYLNRNNLQKMRIEKPFREYEITLGVSFYQFFGQIKNQTLQDRLREFLTNQVIKIETPLIKDNEDKSLENIVENNYFYNGNQNFGGLASGYIWNTLVVSFNSHENWNNDNVVI